MTLKRLRFFSKILLFLTVFGSVFADYQVDFSNPENIVSNACLMLKNNDYEPMTNLLEKKEKENIEESLQLMNENKNAKKNAGKESDKIISFEIIKTEVYTNNTEYRFALVQTKWIMNIEPASSLTKPKSLTDEELKNRKTSAAVYVDYLLELFDGQWKIVQRKTK